MTDRRDIPWRVRLPPEDLDEFLRRSVNNVIAEIEAGTSQIVPAMAFYGRPYRADKVKAMHTDENVDHVEGRAIMPQGLPEDRDEIRQVIASMGETIVQQGITVDAACFYTEAWLRAYQHGEKSDVRKEGIVFSAMHANGDTASAVIVVKREGGQDDGEFIIDSVNYGKSDAMRGSVVVLLDGFFIGAIDAYNKTKTAKANAATLTGMHDRPQQNDFYQLIRSRKDNNGE